MKAKIDYGAELLGELTAKGITQVELAEELGKTKDTIFKALHSGHMKPTTRDTYLAAIARIAAKKENQRLQDKLRRIQAIIEEDRQNGIAKAEQFIRDYTKRCSNELTDGSYHEWLTPDQARRAVEIAMEKVRE